VDVRRRPDVDVAFLAAVFALAAARFLGGIGSSVLCGGDG
jgi:hypothetical protein